MPDFEVRHPIRRSGQTTGRGEVIELSEADAAPLLANGTLRALPKRKAAAPEEAQKPDKPRGRPKKSGGYPPQEDQPQE